MALTHKYWYAIKQRNQNQTEPNGCNISSLLELVALFCTQSAGAAKYTDCISANG